MKPISRCSKAPRLIASAAALVAITIFPVVAMAATALETLSTEVLNVLAPIFVAFIGALASWLLHKLQKKLGVEVGEKTAAAWESLARKAALRGAEWARKQAKGLTEGKKIPGPEVLEVAANWAVEMAKEQKLPELARAKLEGLIEAKLFELRVAGALNDVKPAE